MIADTPDGVIIVNPGEDPRAGVIVRVTSSSRQMYGDDGSARDVAVRPDGSQLIYRQDVVQPGGARSQEVVIQDLPSGRFVAKLGISGSGPITYAAGRWWIPQQADGATGPQRFVAVDTRDFSTRGVSDQLTVGGDRLIPRSVFPSGSERVMVLGSTEAGSSSCLYAVMPNQPTSVEPLACARELVAATQVSPDQRRVIVRWQSDRDGGSSGYAVVDLERLTIARFRVPQGGQPFMPAFQPVWEDATHVLMALAPMVAPPVSRCDVTTTTCELAPEPTHVMRLQDGRDTTGLG